MVVYGTHDGRRVRLELRPRDSTVRLVDDDSGDVIASRPIGEDDEARLSLEGNTVVWNRRGIALDAGERAAATDLVRSVNEASRSAAAVVADNFSDEEIRSELRRQDVIETARRAGGVASFLTYFFLFSGAVVVASGVWRATASESSDLGVSHPNVASGLTLAATGLVFSCACVMLTQCAAAVAKYIGYKADLDATRVDS